MNKLKSFFSRDIKDFNKIILSLGCIIFLLCVGIISYRASNSFALFSGEVSGNKNIKMHYSSYTKNFEYKGEVQEYKTSATGYYYIEMAGASGGNGWTSAGGNGYCTGGRGAKTSGYVYLEKDTKLYFYIGGQGKNGASGTTNQAGGYNGGGAAGNGGSDDSAGGGGGATDVRLTGGAWNDASSLISRIMVASGGGGGSCINNASNVTMMYREGTDLFNPAVTVASWANTCALSNITTTSGNAFGYGASGLTSVTPYGAGGGGGGYYGGSYCHGNSYYSGGQGGTSYISGYAGVNSVNESTTISHTGQTKHYSGKYFVGAEMISGQNSGNGYASIKYVGDKPSRKNTKLNNVRYIKDCLSYSTANDANHWSEIQAIKDGVNIAKGKSVTGTTTQSTDRPYTRITDADLTPSNWSNPSSNATNQCVTVDLGATYDLDEIALWNYFGDQRVYQANNISVSSDNSTWTDLRNNEVWQETSNGARWNAYIDHLNGYVGYDSMYVWYDGYANNGATRNSTTTTWRNLVYKYSTTTNQGAILNGTAAGATWGDRFLTLDGTNDWVRIAQMNYAKPTIEAVFSPLKTHTGESEIVVNWETGGYGLYLNANNTLTGSYYISSGYRPVADDTGIPVNKIVNAATSYDQTTRKLYKQGTLIKSDNTYTGAIGTTQSNTVMAIGANPGGTNAGGNYLNGRIYSVRIYNGVLTDEQIRHNYLYDKQRFNLE